ncbi:tetratricopeptide repeat protein [Streptomyces sp. NPDC048211]|uniref:tetratricopeptide repeat protein n=1 Tax=Streptomyces sp. NPDC048211 TaxID=3365516 RepID=UPI003719DDA5
MAREDDGGGGDGDRPVPAGTALCVVCEEYADERFPRLTGAVAQMDEITGLLEGLGYATRTVGGGNPSWNTFTAESEAWSEGWLATGASGPALVVWSGHGVRADDQLRLVLPDLRPAGDPGQRKARLLRHGVTADLLVSDATASGADQVLVIIDACYAGGGVVPGLGTALRRWEEESAPPGHTKWLGIVASCQSHETSDGSGPLLAALAEVLRTGPADTEYRTAWSPHNALISGPDLLKALAARWEGEGQTLVPATIGTGRPAFPNPLHRPGAPARLVEHLVLAARGVGHREEGWFFTGRTEVLGAIVAWMALDEPGLFLVTGPAGCGKSAVLGRVATLTDPVQRREAVEHGALRDGDPDPGVLAGRTVATVHLRGLTPLQAATELARNLKLPAPRNPDDFRGELRQLSPQPLLILDGLDEVAAGHTQSMIEELVFPLSRTTPVLLGSRARPFRSRLEGNETLVQALTRLIGAGVTTVDLERERCTQENIRAYVFRRCTAGGVADAPAREMSAAISERATAVGGGFLFARLVTSTVLTRFHSPDRSGEDGLLTGLPDSVGAAFEKELRAGPVRVREDGTRLPSAAGDLLAALAWTVGRGMPAGGVWEAVAGALGGGVVYDGSDVDWVLSAYGRYIVEDAEDAQAVYRLYHREFVSHLRGRSGRGGADADRVVSRVMVDLVRQQARVGDWAGIDPYLARGLAAHAVGVGDAGIEMLRELVVWDEESGLPYLAEAVQALSVVLAKSGMHEDALVRAREAVGLYEVLQGFRPAEHLVHLADSLNNLALRLAGTGDRQGALAPAHEATGHYRTLAGQHPTVFLPFLADSLSILANHLARAGDRQGAFAPAHEAVHLYRALAEQHRETFLPDLADSLNNLANHLAETGDRQGALDPAHEAVGLYRTLAGRHPTAFLPHLAASLSNLANHLAETGDRQGALDPAHEAVHIRRTLAGQHPTAFLPGLAGSLNTLALRLAGTGDRQGALAPAHEAVGLYRTLAGQHPTAFLPNLAASLSNLANHLAGTGDRHGALAPSREATALYRDLAGPHPAAFLPDLATSLSNLAVRLAGTGDRQGALDPAHEAVRIRRTLAGQHPAAFLPDLAASLSNLAVRLAETGDRQGALDPAHEAADIHRTLAGQQPAAFLPDLASSLVNLANHLAGTGDQQGALDPAHEAVHIYRTLAGPHPAAFLPDLATALNNLAVRLAETGDRQGALDPAREAVRIRRTLAEQHPAAFLPDLATAVGNLATHLAGTGDRQGALGPAHEAVRIRRTLAEQHPAAFLPDLATALNNLAGHLAETGDVAVAIQAYESAIDALAAKQPTAVPALVLERDLFLIHRPECSTAAGLRGLVGLVSHPAAERAGQVTLQARDALRTRARESTERYEEVAAIWQEETSARPGAWLTLSPDLLDTVGTWMGSPTWTQSRAYWSEHSEVLGSPAAAVALAEHVFVSPSAMVYEALRRLILTHGVTDAFRPLILGERLAAWTECDTWEESEQHLRAHPGLLDAEPPASVPPVHAALLHAARTQGIAAAYALLHERSALQGHVERALTAGDADALRHAAAIEQEVYGDLLSARTHHQAALVLADDIEGADSASLAALVADAPADVRNRLISETAALSGTHAPRHAAHWARIIQVLASPA